MKLLFDQNISYRILKILLDRFDGSIHIRAAGLDNATDHFIWKYAKDHAFTIVTFDSDFSDIATVRGHPPKVIWLRLKDTSTRNIVKVMSVQADMIADFISDPANSEIACLELRDIDAV